MTLSPDVERGGGPFAGLASRWPLALVLALAAAVRFAGLGARSLWTDEASTWTAARLPLRALIERCIHRDASPPLYYLAVKAAIALGDGEARLRLVSALASLALVWLTYRLARLALGRGSATFAALLCALSPFQVMYAQEARTYTMVAALSVWATWLFGRELVRDGRPRFARWALATAAGLWTQSLAALALPGQGLLAIDRARAGRLLRPWLLALAGAAVLYAPWAWIARGMEAHLASSHWYVPETDAQGAFKVLRAVLLAPTPIVTAPAGSPLPGLDRVLPRWIAWELLAVVVVAPLLAGLFWSRARGPRGALTQLAWASWLVPLLAVFAISFRKPLLLARYFVFVTPYVCVCLALGLEVARTRARAWVLAVPLLALWAFGLAHEIADTSKEPWRAVAAHVRALAAPGRTAVLVPFDVDPMAYYLRDGRSGARAFEVSHPDEPFAAAFTPRELDELTAAARANAAPYDEVWVVVRSPNSEVRREVARRAEAVAAEGRTLAERSRWESYGGPLRVTRWVRKAAPDTTR